MMKLSSLALAAALSFGFAHTSSAAPLLATGSTSIQLIDLGIPVTALGNAVDNGGGSFSFPVTGYTSDMSGTTLFHEGSGLQVGPLALRNFQYTLGSPLVFPITLFGDVDGVADDLPLFEVDDEMGALQLSLTPTSAGALGLTDPIAIGTVTNIDFQPVPEPTSLLLLGSAFALAARRMRRA